jgi:NAD+ synthase (glutamine-hydrolysing)
MKIAIAQQNYQIGNFEDNTRKIIEAIEQAKSMKAELVIFSELCICGYPPRDFLEFEDFLDRCDKAIEKVCSHADSIAVLVGAPAKNPVVEGKDLFNAAYFLYEKKIGAIIHKTCLPNYDVFDENRYFEPAYKWQIVKFKDKKLAITICEDIWNLGDNPLYRTCPMDKLIPMKPDIMLNISASPFDYTHVEDRKAILKLNTKKYRLPMIYSNCVGSQTEIVFDGGSLVFDKDSNLVKQLPLFREAIEIIDWKDDGSFDSPVLAKAETLPDEELVPEKFQPTLCIPEVHTAIVTGIRDYFQKMGFAKAIIGSSGGIDSAVTLALACEALGKENVRALLMPSMYSSTHSIDDAKALSEKLDNPYEIISIQKIFDAFMTELKPVYQDKPFNVAEENIQSRIRGNLLMAVANKFGYILLNTSNKSELATGYGTLYGDMAGGLGVLGDCYKMQVYALAEYINKVKEIIPIAIIKKAPSAELRLGQFDSDSLPPYDVLDDILYQYIEKRKGPSDIKSQGFESAIVDRVLKMVNTNEYKRNQFCPIIRISPKAFGPGRRLPIVAKYLS